MATTVECSLDLEDLRVLIDHNDTLIEETEQKLAERRYSFRYSRPQEWMTSTSSMREYLNRLKQKSEYLIDKYYVLFNSNDCQTPHD